jgi:outer membrane murein-binding lipoprotein Lpp
MAKIHLLILLIGTVIVAGVTMTVCYINQIFIDIFKLINEIKSDVKDAHSEVKKLKEDSKD